MKAYEKFEARLRELGLWDDWCGQGKCGRIAKVTNDGIIILCNEGECDKEFSESHFPPLLEMTQDDAFRLNALYEFCDHPDADFVYKLCKWVARPDTNVCPLYPVDVYFCWENAKTVFFEDDPKRSEFDFLHTEEYCPHCDTHVQLEATLQVQICPNCGEWIVPCSVCPLEKCAKHCPLERLATLLNDSAHNESLLR